MGPVPWDPVQATNLPPISALTAAGFLAERNYGSPFPSIQFLQGAGRGRAEPPGRLRTFNPQPSLFSGGWDPGQQPG